MAGWGIDFGTTNTGAAEFIHGEIRTFGANESRPLPSVVAIHKVIGEVTHAGEDALHHAEALAESHHVIRSVKVLLESGRVWVTGARTWSAEMVATEILKSLRAKVTAALPAGDPVPGPALFTIPVGFSAAKRVSLRRAAQAAGFDVAGFIPEPTAAICRYFSRLHEESGWQYVAVFDWGGGTLDVSLCELREREVCEIATDGRPLGGDELDRILARHIHRHLVDAGRVTGPFERVDADSQDRLIALCEQAKRDLSSGTERTTLRMLRYAGGGAVDVELDGAVLPMLFEPQFADALALLEGVVKSSGRSFHEIKLLLVGGSSKVRGLEEYLRERLPDCQIELPIEGDGDWSIAKGAAMLAAHPGEHLIAQELGLRVSDGSFYPLVVPGPAHPGQKRTHYFGLVTDEQQARFTFAQRDGSGRNGGLETLGYLVAQARGFSDELIELETHIDENLVLHARALSDAVENQPAESWSYEKLRFAYRLPRNL
jgi:molecular chaperone DnaK